MTGKKHHALTFFLFPKLNAFIFYLPKFLVIGTTYLAEHVLGIMMCPMFLCVISVVWFSSVRVHAFSLHLNCLLLFEKQRDVAEGSSVSQ